MTNPTFENKRSKYTFTRPEFTCEVGRMHVDHDRTSCQLIFTNPKDQSHIMRTRLNIETDSARKRLAKELSERYPVKNLDWPDTVEYIAEKTMRELEHGEPVITIQSTDEYSELKYLIHPIVPEGKPTAIFGDPGSGKSQLAVILSMVMTLPWTDNPLKLGAPDNPVKVLFLDYEADIDDIQRQLALFTGGMDLGYGSIEYRRCSLPISDDLEGIRTHIEETGARCLIIDSVSLAAGGDLNRMDVATNYVRSLRSLGSDITTISLAHTSKDRESKVKTILGCYAEGTEVLTKEGWKQHRDITLLDEVACYEPETKALRWWHPVIKFQYDYSGKMVSIHHGTLRALITPNHRVLTANHGIIEAKQLGHFQRNAYKIPHQAPLKPSGKHLGNSKGLFQMEANSRHLPLNDWLRFLGYWISEGNLSNPNEIGLTQSVGDTLEDMKVTLNNLGFSFTERNRKRGKPNWATVHYLHIRYDAGEKLSGRQKKGRGFSNKVKGRKHLLFRWLTKNCGHSTYTKRMPDFIWTLRRSQQKLFLDALIAGDGHILPNGSAQYYTVSKELADGVQRLATLCGIGNYMTSRKRYAHSNVQYEIYMSKPCRKTITIAPRNVREEDYSGKVYCLSVPTGFYVTRYHGYVNIMGNSVLFEAGFRSVWEIRANEDEDSLEVALFHRKANLSKRFQDIGFRINYMEKGNTIEWLNPKSVPEFVERMSTHQRVLSALKAGPLSTIDLIEQLELKRSSIDNAVSKLSRKGFVTGNSKSWSLPLL